LAQRVTIVDGTEWTGLYAPDGSFYVQEAPGGSYTGIHAPCGGWYVEFTESPVAGSYSPTGAFYVSTTPQGAALLVEVVGGEPEPEPEPEPEYEAESTALFTRVASAGGTWNDTKKGHVDTLIATLKTAGVWSKLDVLNVWTESASAVAILDWKDLTTVDSQVGCSFSATNGLTTDGVTGSGIQLNYNPNTAGGNFTLNSASMGIWLKTPASTTGPGIGGGTAWANIEDGSNRVGFRLNDGSTNNSATNSNTDGTGLFVLSRVAADDKKSYKNGNTTPLGNHTTTSTSVANSKMHVATNALGTAPYTSQILMSFFGGGLTATEQQDIYNAFNTYFTAIGAL
jgi:hypothetical protein